MSTEDGVFEEWQLVQNSKDGELCVAGVKKGYTHAYCACHTQTEAQMHH